ncbi:MAG: type II toxin-antitoxin system RelE/ParE family toxin [Phycisphaerales bacterium]|jgi:hypothetical protein|nr:type II toxin-antitoxin system RelE/ParE family toxin [Phycisphaerales bacterium]
MHLTFVQLTGFVNDWKHFRLTDVDLRALEQQLLCNPEAGPTMAATGGIRKIRFAPPSGHRGKSGPFRIVYLYLPATGKVFFLSMFSKSERANLTSAQKAEYKKVVEIFKSHN